MVEQCTHFTYHAPGCNIQPCRPSNPRFHVGSIVPGRVGWRLLECTTWAETGNRHHPCRPRNRIRNCHQSNILLPWEQRHSKVGHLKKKGCRKVVRKLPLPGREQLVATKKSNTSVKNLPFAGKATTTGASVRAGDVQRERGSLGHDGQK